MRHLFLASALLALTVSAASAKRIPVTLQFSGPGQVQVNGKAAESGMTLPRSALITVSGGAETLTVNNNTITSSGGKFRLSGSRLKCLNGTLTVSTPSGTQTLAAGQSMSLEAPTVASAAGADSGLGSALPPPPPGPTAQQNIQAGVSSAAP